MDKTMQKSNTVSQVHSAPDTEKDERQRAFTIPKKKKGLVEKRKRSTAVDLQEKSCTTSLEISPGTGYAYRRTGASSSSLSQVNKSSDLDSAEPSTWSQGEGGRSRRHVSSVARESLCANVAVQPAAEESARQGRRR